MVESEYHLDAETLTEVFGTTDRGFNYGLLRQLRRASPDDHDEIEFMLAVIRDLKPRNRLDAMLAAQMAAVHMATMTSRRTACASRHHAGARQRWDRAE